MGYIRDRWKDPARVGKGRRWQVKYRVDGRERDGGSFDNKEVAKRRLVELEAAVLRGRWVDIADRTTVAEAARVYAETRPYRPATVQMVNGYIVNHIEPTSLGSRRLVTVRPSDVQAWVTERSTKMAPSTLRALVKFVRAVFAAAVLDHRIARSPFVRITLPRHEQGRIVPLTVDQVQQLADAVPAKYRAMVVAQAGLGLRIGELLALRVADVDFLRKSVRVEHQIDKRTRERVPPKTPRSRRAVPLPDVVAVALAEHIRNHPPITCHDFSREWCTSGFGPDSCPYLLKPRSPYLSCVPCRSLPDPLCRCPGAAHGRPHRTRGPPGWPSYLIPP